MSDLPDTVNVVATMANLFGCHEDADLIDHLCDISDLAANVRFGLVDSDLVQAAKEMDLEVEFLVRHHVVWEH